MEDGAVTEKTNEPRGRKEGGIQAPELAEPSSYLGPEEREPSGRGVTAPVTPGEPTVPMSPGQSRPYAGVGDGRGGASWDAGHCQGAPELGIRGGK